MNGLSSYRVRLRDMLTAAFITWLAAAALAGRYLQGRHKFVAARLCLWSGLIVALVAFQGHWIPSRPLTIATFVVFFIYVVIQDIRIQAAASASRSSWGRKP